MATILQPAAQGAGTPAPTLFDLPVAPQGFGVVLPPAQLRKIDFSGLDFETARRAIIEYIRTYYPDNFNDFVASNGAIMFLEIVAAATAKLAMRSDILVQEAFLPTAQTEEAVVNHLALINQKIQRQTPAVVDVQCSLTNPVYTDVHIPAGTNFQARASTAIHYEIFRAPGDFTSDIIIPAGKQGVIAVGIQGTTLGPTQFISDGTANQQYYINNANILNSPITVSVVTGASGENWTVVSDPIERYGPLDKVVETIFLADRFLLRFGNNISGAQPAAGNLIQATYRVGGGIVGRIGIGQLDETRQLLPEAPANSPVQVRFRNIAPSSGGTDRETISAAKRRAPHDYAMRTGIVTADDYAYAAQTFSHPVYGSVIKAAAALRSGLNANLIEVYCLAMGSDGRPTTPNMGLKAGLTTYYNQLNVLTDHVAVLDGLPRQVDVDMLVVVSRVVNASLVKMNVEQTITDFFHIDKWDMGQPLYISNLIELVSSIDGVNHVDLYSPTSNILPIADPTRVAAADRHNYVVFNELIIEGKRTVQYFYEKADRT